MKCREGDRVVVAGGSGFLGRLIAAEFAERGLEVIILTRNPSQSVGRIRNVLWDGRTLGPWAERLEAAKAVINLAGRSLNCRYTPGNRREIVESRVESVKVIGEAIRRCGKPPQVLVQAGSLGIYGDAGDRWCDEHAPFAEDFPAQTCVSWEKAFGESPTPGTRRVLLRIGFVLGASGGALKVMANLTRWGLGGTFGSGRQYISWLHERDMNAIFLAAIEREYIRGIFNVTGPNPVSNAQFMRELRRVLRRPWTPRAPVWAVHVGSWLMRTEPCLALMGRRCPPTRLLEGGFMFKFPKLREALENIYGQEVLR